MKSRLRNASSFLIVLGLAGCSAGAPASTIATDEPTTATATGTPKSDSLACEHMNMDFLIDLLSANQSDIPSENVHLTAMEVRNASKLAESSLLKNIMVDNAQTIQNMEIAADDAGNEFILQIVVNSFQEVVSACESVR